MNDPKIVLVSMISDKEKYIEKTLHEKGIDSRLKEAFPLQVVSLKVSQSVDFCGVQMHIEILRDMRQ